MRFLNPRLDLDTKTPSIPTAVATAGAATYGTEASGTYASTHANDGTNWVIAEATGSPGFYLTMSFTAPVPGQAAAKLTISGYYSGNLGHTVNVDAYNWASEGHDNLGTLPDAAAETVYTFNFTANHTDVDGSVLFRIDHISPGNVTHRLYLDWVYIQ